MMDIVAGLDFRFRQEDCQVSHTEQLCIKDFDCPVR